MAAFQSLETLGGNLSITRHYLAQSWNLGNFVEWSVAQGNTPLISPHALYPWAEYAAGLHDDELTAFASDAAALGVPLYLVFHHEPENDALGTPADFAGAAQRFYEVVKPLCPACTLGVTFMRNTFTGGHGGLQAWLPTDFDVLGADVYDRQGTTQLSQLATPALNAARARGKPLIINETGTIERSRNYKRDWFRNALTFLNATPDVVAVCYSHVHSAEYNLDYWVDTSPRSLTGWRDLVAAA